MTFHKQLSIFATALIVIPMAVFFVISTVVMDSQITHSEQAYLQNAILIARNSMMARKSELLRGAQYLAGEPEFRRLLGNNDKLGLIGHLNRLREVYPYIDFAVALNGDRRMLASYPDIMRPEGRFDLNGLVEKVQLSKKSIFSEEVFELSLLFSPDSPSFQQFRVKLAGNSSEELPETYLTRCEAGVIVVPVCSDNDLLGFIVLGDIANNDQYFPDTYSRLVKESYLAISVDGIRITSNISTPKKTSYIGSRMPIEMDSLEGERLFYFGRVNIDGEIHVFLDAPILDSEGKIAAVLGIGIPEERFSQIISSNRNIVLVVTVTSLCAMLIAAKYMADRITRPILLATSMAEKIRRGERNLQLYSGQLSGGKNETSILLTTFQQMAAELVRGEEKRKQYLLRLKDAHRRQKRLAKELQIVNSQLEDKVTARTQDLQQAIMALKKADEVKSQFLANMSHELRTPLNSIICSAEVIRDKLFGPLSEKQERYIRTIWSSGTHLLQLINDILDICKIEAGKMQLSLSTFSVAEIVENSFHVVKSLAYGKNIDVSIIIEPPAFMIRADAKKLRQILYNLLSNAIKFTPDYGQVSLEVVRREALVRFSVRDNGIGIREEDQARVFNEFEQVDSSYSRQYEGTGLGLPLTKKLVEMHGGEIYLASKPGKGTEVIFTIPVDTEAYLENHIS